MYSRVSIIGLISFMRMSADSKGSAVNSVSVSIILVNYNGGKTVLDCLRSVFCQTRDISFEVLVVDNASEDGSAEEIRRLFPKVNLIRNPDNPGFARACNQALETYRGGKALLLNPDTVLLDNAVGKMAGFLDETPDTGIAGCMLLNEDGTYQKSAGRVRGIVNECREKWTRTGLDRQSRAAWKREERFAGRVRSVDWVSGAFLMVRRPVVDRIGLLDAGMILFFEDIEWCARARGAGWKVLYNPHVRVVHRGGQSVARNPVQGLLEYRRSQLRFYRTQYGAGPDTQALRLYLMARALFGFAETGLPAGAGTCRGPEDRARMRGFYRELLRLALRG